MTKKTKITIVSLLSVLLLIMCTILALVLVAHSQDDNRQPTQELSQWIHALRRCASCHGTSARLKCRG